MDILTRTHIWIKVINSKHIIIIIIIDILLHHLK